MPSDLYRDRSLRELALGIRIDKAGVLDADDDLFTVVGQVMINLIIGEVTTVMDGGASTVLLNEKTDSIALCAATTITSDAVGELYVVTGQPEALLNGGGTPVLKVAAATALHDSATDRAPVVSPMIFGLGNGALGSLTIESTETGDDTGEILWSLFYTPMEDGAYVEAAA